MHADIGEELLASIFQAGPKDVDYIVDNQETVVVSLTVIDCYGWILLIMPLDVELQLSHILRQVTGVDGGRDVGCAMAQHGQGIDVDVVVDERDGAFGLLDEVDDMGIGIEDLPVVEDAFYWWQGRTDEEIDLTLHFIQP